MTIEKKIAVELTEQEYSILTRCEEIIDEFISKMQACNLQEYETEYGTFDEHELDELAEKVHSLRTIHSAI